jgi:hypothetical protein
MVHVAAWQWGCGIGRGGHPLGKRIAGHMECTNSCSGTGSTNGDM